MITPNLISAEELDKFVGRSIVVIDIGQYDNEEIHFGTLSEKRGSDGDYVYTLESRWGNETETQDAYISPQYIIAVYEVTPIFEAAYYHGTYVRIE